MYRAKDCRVPQFRASLARPSNGPPITGKLVSLSDIRPFRSYIDRSTTDATHLLLLVRLEFDSLVALIHRCNSLAV